MKCGTQGDLVRHTSRSPHGERGLKYNAYQEAGRAVVSLPSRGAWIEITLPKVRPRTAPCRSPHGERGLKSLLTVGHVGHLGRSPHGERGLK